MTNYTPTTINSHQLKILEFFFSVSIKILCGFVYTTNNLLVGIGQQMNLTLADLMNSMQICILRSFLRIICKSDINKIQESINIQFI